MKTGQTATRRTAGALSLIFICLIASGILRLGVTRSAIAEEVAFLRQPEAATPDDGPIACTPPPETADLLAAIRKRQAGLIAQEAQLQDRLQALRVAEKKLQENTIALIAAEERLTATLAIADSAAEKDLMKLTAVYENMKPKNAAGVFGQMAPEFAAGFLGRMKAESAANILSILPPEQAYTISLLLAGRNARAPVE